MTAEFYDCTIKYQLYQIILFVAFVLSLYKWKRTSEKILLSSFLFFCVCIELLVNKYFNCFIKNSAAPNNVYVIIVICFYVLFFKDVLDLMSSHLLIYLLSIYSVISIVYTTVLDLAILHTAPYLIGLIITTVLVCFYLFDLITRVSTLFEVFQEPRFWLGCGIVIFTSINFPILFHLEEIRYNENLGFPLFEVIQLSNIMLSLSYLICVLCHQRTTLYLTK